MENKKEYEKPKVKSYGDLKKITQGAGGTQPEGSTLGS